MSSSDPTRPLVGPLPENFTDTDENQLCDAPAGQIESGSWQSKEFTTSKIVAVSPSYPTGIVQIVVEPLYPCGLVDPISREVSDSRVWSAVNSNKSERSNREVLNEDREQILSSTLFHKAPHESSPSGQHRPGIHLLLILSCESGIVEQILRLLRPASLAAVASTCRAARRAVDSPTLWESCILRDYPTAATSIAAAAAAAASPTNAVMPMTPEAPIPSRIPKDPAAGVCTFHYERPLLSHPRSKAGAGCAAAATGYKRQYRRIVQRQGIYLVGGCAGDLSAVATVSRLGVGGAGGRPAAAAPPLRTARIFAAAAEVGGQLLVCGGCTSLSACLRSVEVRARPPRVSWPAWARSLRIRGHTEGGGLVGG